MGCFVFGGVDYSDALEVVSIDMPALPEAAPDLRAIGGTDGAYLADTRLEPLEIKVKARLATEGIDPRDVQRAWAEAIFAMRTSEPEPLYLTDDVYRLAVLTDRPDLSFAGYSGTATLVFLCPDPVAYGEERTVAVPSGGSVTFEVGGTYPARPTITANAVRDAQSLVWGVRLDGGDFLNVATGSASARAVAIDCARRTCTVAGAAALPTLDSDWLALAPGEHTMAMPNGTGAATVKFVERWL